MKQNAKKEPRYECFTDLVESIEWYNGRTVIKMRGEEPREYPDTNSVVAFTLRAAEKKE